jgi:hypothetical protein
MKEKEEERDTEKDEEYEEERAGRLGDALETGSPERPLVRE